MPDMAYKPYPTAKDTPSRKSRKSSRYSVFAYNKKLAALKRRAKRDAKRAAQELAEQEAEQAE